MIDIKEVELDFFYYIAWTVATGAISKAKSARVLGLSLEEWEVFFGELAEKIKDEQCLLQSIH